MDIDFKHNLAYLATPYSKYPGGLDAAFEEAARIAGELLKRGVTVYSPIAHTHPIAKYAKMDPLDHSVWIDFDETMMELCDVIIVAQMDTWRESKGVEIEIAHFRNEMKPVYFLDPVTLITRKDYDD